MRSTSLALLVASASGLRKGTKHGDLAAARHLEGVPVFEIASETAPQDQWIVFMKDGSDDAAIEAFCAQTKCKTAGHASRGGLPFVAVRGSEAALAKAVEGNKAVDFITPDYALQPDLDPSPEDAAQAEREAMEGGAGIAASDWGLDRIGLPYATHTGKGANVYVFDSGVNTRHDEFDKRAIPTLDWKSADSRVEACNPADRDCADDYLGHGTHVAGIVAGRDYGVAKDATIRSMTMYFNESDGGMSVAYAQIDWLIRNAELPAVLQMSFGFPKILPGAEVAIQKVVDAGITVVAAGGNSGKDACRYTWGGIPGVIVVAASDSRDSAAIFTNHGECTTLYAPGVSIRAANWKGGLTSKSGTSMAAPMVSGAIALLLEENPALTPAEIKELLIARAEPDAIRSNKAGTPNLLLKVAVTPPTPAPPCPSWCSRLLCWVDQCKVCDSCS